MKGIFLPPRQARSVSNVFQEGAALPYFKGLRKRANRSVSKGCHKWETLVSNCLGDITQLHLSIEGQGAIWGYEVLHG